MKPCIDIADWLIRCKLGTKCHTEPGCHPEHSEGSSVMPGSTGHLPVSPPPLCPEPPIHPIQQILNQPEVAALIADLDLQLTSITKLNN